MMMMMSTTLITRTIVFAFCVAVWTAMIASLASNAVSLSEGLRHVCRKPYLIGLCLCCSVSFLCQSHSNNNSGGPA